MSTTYTYSLLHDFQHGLSATLFARQVVDALLGQPLENVNSVDDVVEVVFEDELTGGAVAQLVQLVADHDPTDYSFEANYNEKEYVAGRLARDTWYAWKNPAGDYLFKVEETTYSYSLAGMSLDSEQLQTFDPMGNALVTRTWEYETVTNDVSVVIRKEEV